MTDEEHGQLKAEAWRTLKAVDHVDAKAADEGLNISPEWRAWRSQVRAVIRGERMDIPAQPARYRDAYKVHWETMTSGTLAEAAAAPVFEEASDLRARIAELEALVLKLTPTTPDPTEPPAEALAEAYPDEDHATLKARILAEFASLRNALVGHIPMTMEQLTRLQTLEHPKFQTWLQG
jgi:hypothetical protein